MFIMAYKPSDLLRAYEEIPVGRRTALTLLAGAVLGVAAKKGVGKLLEPQAQTVTEVIPDNPARRFFDLYDRHRDLVGSNISIKVGDILYHTDSHFSRTLFGKVLTDSPLKLNRSTHPVKYLDGTIYNRREKFYVDLGTGRPLYFQLGSGGDKIPVQNFEAEERKEIEQKSAESLEALTNALREQIRRKVRNSEST